MIFSTLQDANNKAIDLFWKHLQEMGRYHVVSDKPPVKEFDNHEGVRWKIFRNGGCAQVSLQIWSVKPDSGEPTQEWNVD